ncbi:glycosyltransferase family 2 protein [Agitococcus lubricus]|uniref:Nucleotidyltransferase-like protein n=1 Tax=Agitococcus lubricus TaxID=1077255 RepID=A0A2T5J0X3_9GAMM|nr:glycosyltransferase family 2 protein [Agitococcus lubricus]PTQ90040.1 nucleotidyltransferase-like protein [Agitococcus lubricus]
MLNIIVLMAGPDRVFADGISSFPTALIEFKGKPIIENLISACESLSDAKMLFVARAMDVKKFRLENVIALLKPNSKVIAIDQETKGAACSALLAASYIDHTQPLLILTIDDILDVSFADVIKDFQQRELDAGAVVFSSVHPRYSFVRLNQSGLVSEAAEKNPISRHAIAGCYYYAHGGAFVEAAKSMIRKDAQVDGKFYISPTFNELILRQAKIGVYPISINQYHPIKSQHQLEQYEHMIEVGVK